jgi:4-amino-4-deoxy-L-arabinose transferase-like glycosyltransferase
MSPQKAHGLSPGCGRNKAELALLTFATLACLVPFINKAYAIDDPLFLWAGKHIQSHPLDFFGFAVNWDGKLIPMHVTTKNPPPTCYYIALAAAVGGWSEPALHVAFLLPALGAILGTWYTARRLCRQPLGAALCTLATPVFLVSSTSVMCDTMALCFWVWAVGLWIEGLETGSWPRLSAAGFLIAASALSKYFGTSLIPLLAAYTLVRSPRQAGKLVALLIPIAILTGYQLWTKQLYGRGLLLDAAEFAAEVRAQLAPVFWLQGLVILCFTGGCCFSVGFCAPWMLGRRGMAILAAAAIATGVVIDLWTSSRLFAFIVMPTFRWGLTAQLALQATLGGLVLWLAVGDLRKHRDAGAVLLALWLLGTAAFAGYVNWTCNGRSVLPMVPVVGILIVRRIDDRCELSPTGFPRWMWGLVPAVAVALMVAWADYCQAASGREAAVSLVKAHQSRMDPMSFQGHWGFQYYMEGLGNRAVDFAHFQVRTGDLMIIPEKAIGTMFPRPEAAEIIDTVKFSNCPWLTTWDSRAGAGFYGSFFGPMPFVFCPAPTELYGVWRFKTDSQSVGEVFLPTSYARRKK